MSDYETTQRRRNIVVGIFVIVALCALGWLITMFGELPKLFSSIGSFQIFVQLPSAPGVQQETPVRFCGYQIGKVTEVMSPRVRRDLVTGLEYHQTTVVLSIEDKYLNIPSNVDVRVMSRGLGSSYMELRADPLRPRKPLDPNRPETEFLVQGLMLQGSIGAVSEFVPEELQNQISELAVGLKTFVDHTNEIIGDSENKENVKLILANLSDASAKAKVALEGFSRLSSAGVRTLQNVDNRTDKLAAAVSDVSAELSKTLTRLQTVMEKVDEGEGTAARFVNDGRLYENLLEVTGQLEVLLKEVNSFVAKARKEGVPIKLK